MGEVDKYFIFSEDIRVSESKFSFEDIAQRTIKRTFDILLSGLGLIISFPVWILNSLAIIIESGGPIFIKQRRVGRNGDIFHVLKFRSMDKKAHTESPTEHVDNREERITVVGRIIRATAMDELPQLLSIFIGDMSFVGPRPVHPEEPALNESKYDSLVDVPDFRRRTMLRPGLTGIAQVYAKKDIPIENKVKYDLLYLRKHNFYLDVRLILLSFIVTFTGRWEKEDMEIRRIQRSGVRTMNKDVTGIYGKRPYKLLIVALLFSTFILLLFLQGRMSTIPQPILRLYSVKFGSICLGEIVWNLAHIPVYAILTIFLIRMFLLFQRKRNILKALMFSLSITVLIGVFDEFHQLYIPGRSASFMDFGVDLAGVGIVMVFYLYIFQRKWVKKK